jgi:ubiquinone/menaquinone biosynthesis C-methylase UbiE
MFVLRDFPYTEFPPGARILDVGLGKGEQTRALLQRGCRPVAVELDPEKARAARGQGFAVIIARAEQLPFVDGAFDGAIMKVVLPYTDEAIALIELGRILGRGATARLCYHGIGYSLNMLREPNWKRRAYASRVIANTILYALTGRRLPGFLGGAIYQSRNRLRRHYRRAGLQLVEDRPAPRFLNCPVFIYHTLSKSAAPLQT